MHFSFQIIFSRNFIQFSSPLFRFFSFFENRSMLWSTKKFPQRSLWFASDFFFFFFFFFGLTFPLPLEKGKKIDNINFYYGEIPNNKKEKSCGSDFFIFFLEHVLFSTVFSVFRYFGVEFFAGNFFDEKTRGFLDFLNFWVFEFSIFLKLLGTRFPIFFLMSFLVLIFKFQSSFHWILFGFNFEFSILFWKFLNCIEKVTMIWRDFFGNL